MKSGQSRQRSDSHGSARGRERVPKACQRCRLKKCKCDGLIPCCRCKSDDEICAYKPYQTSDKFVYRRGYVQILERQHAQLNRGIHVMYTFLLNSGQWPGMKLDAASQTGSQPSIHEILARLGVLQTALPDEIEVSDDTWQTLDRHSLKEGMLDVSAPISPMTQTPCSLLAPTSPQHTSSLTVPQSALQLSPITAQVEGKHDPTMKNHYTAEMPQLETPFLDGEQGCPLGPDVVCSTQYEPLVPEYLIDGSMYLGGGNSTLMKW